MSNQENEQTTNEDQLNDEIKDEVLIEMFDFDRDDEIESGHQIY